MPLESSPIFETRILSDDGLSTASSTSLLDDSITSVSDSPSSSLSDHISLPSAPSKVLCKQGSPIPLDQYLPLGCLRSSFHMNRSLDVGCLPCNSNEQNSPLPQLGGSRTLQAALDSLVRAFWVQVVCFRSSYNEDRELWRIYILPEDVGRTKIDRSSKSLRKSLDEVLQAVDISPRTWNGDYIAGSEIAFDLWAAAEDSSLFYIFNTLPSPHPTIEHIRDRYSRAAIKKLLDPHETVLGLKTPLYSYQRRTAATMLQREVAPEMQLDPRLESRQTTDGQTYYYGARDRAFLRNPRFYDSVRGGILAETMGLGKTLICIAVILATKGHWPAIPPQHRKSTTPVRSVVGSLTAMAAATISRHPIAWRSIFDNIKARTGEEMHECIKCMENEFPHYEITSRVIRSNRSSNFFAPPETIQLCSSTIIVVPRNLMHQWQSELQKHVEEGFLHILVMDDPKKPLPTVAELSSYDVVLFSKSRFESEGKDVEDFYTSPLKKLHWLRIIIDEGHYFSSSSSRATIVAERLVRAERRWVVSGTPAKDLLGVEVNLTAMSIDEKSSQDFRRKALEHRKFFNRQDESSGAIKSLGALAAQFLQAQPWTKATVDGLETSASWEDYIYRHTDLRSRTYTCFSQCLRGTLQNLVVKTRPEDVERDLKLPPLTHRVVRLKPSFYDKMTANLFVLVFMANAVTSERTDVDYLFHKASQPHLHRLISNLRQSGFFWTGFDGASVAASIKTTLKYFDRENSQCTPEDRKLLQETVDAAKLGISTPIWKALSRSQEMGIVLEDWPKDTARFWAFNDCQDPMVAGITQTIQAQKYINKNLDSADPVDGFAGAGISTNALVTEQMNSDPRKTDENSSIMIKLGVPSSSVSSDTMGLKRLSVSGVSNDMSLRSSPKKRKLEQLQTNQGETKSSVEKPRKRAKRRLSNENPDIELSPDSALGRTRITATTSAKFSYLIDRVMALYREEKIIIFYEAPYIAYYLSQAFDLLNVKHLIYANTLSGEQRSKYIVLFDTDPNQRVILMDIKQAAHGLNLSSASRVFFVNPVCRPNIEAQAIKRAHRIGQTRPVHVETLILKGTIEEAMHERATNMTSREHLAAKDLENDSTITRIIQEARVLPLQEQELSGYGQMARLETPQQLFGRPGRARREASGLEAELFGDDGDDANALKPAKKRGRSRKNNNEIVNEQQVSEEMDTEGYCMPPPGLLL